jgi:hypothetical protein
LEKEGKYIYCIIADGNQKKFGPIGIDGTELELYTISYKNISAVVSNSHKEKYEPWREYLFAHEKAIETVMKSHPVLPVRFSTIAESDQSIKKILENKYDSFVELLKYIQDKKELGLIAKIDMNIICHDILEKNEEIRYLKEKIEVLPASASYYKRVEIGRLVEAALEKEKEAYKTEILKTLSPLALEARSNKVYGQQMLINAAFLIHKQKETQFEQRVEELADIHINKIKYKLLKVIPPYNFINLVIQTGSYNVFN